MAPEASATSAWGRMHTHVHKHLLLHFHLETKLMAAIVVTEAHLAVLHACEGRGGGGEKAKMVAAGKQKLKTEAFLKRGENHTFCQ